MLLLKAGKLSHEELNGISIYSIDVQDGLNLCECRNGCLMYCKVGCTKRGEGTDNEHTNQHKARSGTAVDNKNHTELANSSPHNVCGSAE